MGRCATTFARRRQTEDAESFPSSNMIRAMSLTSAYAERELVVTRLFDAPRDLVYKTWTDPRQALRWWGSETSPATHVQIDLRPGGAWSGRLRAHADGRESRQMGILHEVIPPSRLMFTFAWDEDGQRGLETLVTVTFAAETALQTRVTVHQRPFKSRRDRDENVAEWAQALDRFEACVIERRAKSMA